MLVWCLDIRSVDIIQMASRNRAVRQLRRAGRHGSTHRPSRLIERSGTDPHNHTHSLLLRTSSSEALNSNPPSQTIEWPLNIVSPHLFLGVNNIQRHFHFYKVYHFLEKPIHNFFRDRNRDFESAQFCGLSFFSGMEEFCERPPRVLGRTCS